MARNLYTLIISAWCVQTLVCFFAMSNVSYFLHALGDSSGIELTLELVTWIVFLVWLIPGVVVGLCLAYKIARPLKDVTTAVRSIASGDYSTRAQAARSSFSEADALILDCNATADRLEKAQVDFKYSKSVIAHELRTPLGVLLGNLQGLSDGVFEPSRARYERLICHVNDLTRIVEDLQTLGLASPAISEIALEELDLAVEAEAVISSLEQDLVTAGITMERNFGRAVVLADRTRMRQVLLAMLDNACRYAPGSTVVVHAFTAENRAVIRCMDTGPGMPAEAQARAFDRYWRGGDPRTRVSGGSGLGLSIVQEIARLHRGDANIGTNCLGGLTVQVWVPL
ncbi:HAMP domain-containing protein [Sinorhizobium meliloti]|nr:HAMP domain-containing protein [Sinorhizobium meliloti]MDW9751631.1 HAMP domain-containing protein [Sinorhizobium meliloti]MDX0359461.1 HAMP domain-containing protein [Sinorhizobium meliloti]